MKVAVYWNLHKNIFSIQSRETSDYGKVIAHKDSVVVALPKFVVRQAGRDQVLQDKKKNVHAFVVGHLTEARFLSSGNPFRISYNPYKNNSFVLADTKEEILSAAVAVLSMQGNHPIIEAYV